MANLTEQQYMARCTDSQQVKHGLGDKGRNDLALQIIEQMDLNFVCQRDVVPKDRLNLPAKCAKHFAIHQMNELKERTCCSINLHVAGLLFEDRTTELFFKT